MKIASYRKNILAIRIVNSGGGAEASVGNLLNFLKKNNIIIRDLCFSEFKKKGRSLRNFFAVFRYIYQIRVESKTADYLLACVEGAPFLIAAIATMGISKPPVLWLHCEPTEYLRFASVKQRLLIRLSILLADNIICASPWYANYISQSSRKKVQFLSNFIVTESISDGVPYKCDVPRSHYIYVGSLSRLKNVSACTSFYRYLAVKNLYFLIFTVTDRTEKN